MTGAELIAAERQRQVDVEGYTAEHDAQHMPEELAAAGDAYLSWARSQLDGEDPVHLHGRVPEWWPWEPRHWKPDASPTRNLVKAGALIAAAIDRALRA